MSKKKKHCYAQDLENMDVNSSSYEKTARTEEDGCHVEEDGNLNPHISDSGAPQKGVPIFGFLSRNRAFHGDEVIGLRQRRFRDKKEGKDAVSSITEQCRIVKITKRSSALSSFVAVLDVESCLSAAENFRCQPQDTRWPAFNVIKREIPEEMLKQIECLGNSGKLFCLMCFDDWKENYMEPRGKLIRILGNVLNPDAQMEASMIFHGLNPNGFSDAVIDDLKHLIHQAQGVKDEDRIDYRDHLVFTIDPQDAKDLDDALSVEMIKDDKGKYKYRVGVHIADVSHYVKGGSLVDLDARQRATSVYLEHRVFPMLPPLLSENLCSLLPNSEKLCFSMFADLVEDSYDGEMVGSNLFITNQSFVLSRIISTKRLSYNTAKEIIYKHIGNNPDSMAEKMESMSFSEFQSIIVEEVMNSGNVCVPHKSLEDSRSLSKSEYKVTEDAHTSVVRDADHDTNESNIVVALLSLYFISRKLRHFRLKQRGAVMVDTNGSQKCHIPRVGESISKLWMEQIPKESHELVEEMMLLANTQAAQLLSKSFDRYFLRVHENTSKAIKQLIVSMMPQELKNVINPDILPVPELLRKCAKNMDPTAFQSLSFAALQQFKEAVYSPINKEDKYTSTISGHWGLALPVYLHFTSPIRRYSDLYTHRMLKTVINGTYTEQSLKVLDDICKQCNLQKRKAFDVQKNYKNFAFNQYLRWACTTDDGSNPYASKSPMFAKCSNKANSDTWGMIYDDACIFSIVLNDANKKDVHKSSIVFYIPMLNEQRSVSCESLNVEPVEALVNGEKINLCMGNSKNVDPMMDGYLKEVKKATDRATDTSSVQSLIVVKDSDKLILSQYQKIKVILIPGSQMWTVRLPHRY